LWTIGYKRKNKLVEEFVEYLEEKRIDALAFKKGDADLFVVWENEFMQMHPKSFTSQKLYLINNIRRQYLLPEDRVKQPVKKVKLAAKKPLVVKPKPVSEEGKDMVKPVLKPKIAETVDSLKKKIDTVAPKTPVVKASSLKPEIGIKKPVIKPKITGNVKEVTAEQRPNKKVLAPKIPVKGSALRPKIMIKKEED